MSNCHSLQDVLRDRVDSGFVKCYPLGDITDPICLSYSELYNQARHNVAKIQSIPGFKVHHPILLHLDSFLESIIWFWSVLFANGMPVILSSNVNHVRDHLKGLAMLLEHPICITTTKLTSTFDKIPGLHLHTIQDMKRQEMPSAEPVGHCQYQGGLSTAILMLTSGSTGMPKAVKLSHAQILAAVAGKAAVRPLSDSLPFFNWIGLDHVASLVEIHIQALWLGVDQIHAHAADVVASPTTFLSIIHRHKVSKTFAPNFFLAKLVPALQDEERGYEDWDLSSLTMLASGGEDNDIDTCLAASSFLHKHGAPLNVITTGFGMTETCAGAIFNLDCPAYDVKTNRTVASLGTCMEGIEMRITVPGQNSQLALPREPGNLEIRGRVVFDGYYRNPDATSDAFTSDGWFRTGDQAMLDSQGALCLIGRTKDVVNINGAKFALSNIQSALEQALSHQVSRLVTFASRAAHTEQVIVAYTPGKSNEKKHEILEIQDCAARICQLQVGATPIIFALREASVPLLPTSSLGKISRSKMRSLYESGAFSEDIGMYCSQVRQLKEQRLALENRDVNDTESLIIGVLSELQRVSSGAVGMHTSIFELGFSSIDVIRLKLRIEQLFGVSLPVTTLLRHPSPSSLAKALDSEFQHHSSGSTADSDYDPVVAFNDTGSKSPLWLIHPGIGEVLVFVGLAQYMADDDRPVYALRARGFEPGQERFKTIEETVDTYITAIRKRQPQGPYAIAGYSYGAMLAFEITKKVEAADGAGAVKFLGSFNLPPYIKTRMRQLVWNNCLLHLTHFLGLATEAEAERIEASEFQDMSQDGALGHILAIANAERLDELGLDKAGLARWTDVAYDLPRMATDYDPQGDVAVLDVFHAFPLKAAAPNREEWVNDHLSKWQDFCKSTPRFHKVGGAHYTMIGPDHVAAFSATLRSALRARGI